jgi:hypothetical protein
MDTFLPAVSPVPDESGRWPAGALPATAWSAKSTAAAPSSTSSPATEPSASTARAAATRSAAGITKSGDGTRTSRPSRSTKSATELIRPRTSCVRTARQRRIHRSNYLEDFIRVHPGRLLRSRCIGSCRDRAVDLRLRLILLEILKALPAPRLFGRRFGEFDREIYRRTQRGFFFRGFESEHPDFKSI